MDTTDSRSTEKSRLLEQLRAHFESEGDEESRRTALMFRFMPSRVQHPDDVIAPGTLVRVETGGRESWVLLVPNLGGHVTDFDGLPLQVLTSRSPLGEALLGRRCGETVSVLTRSGATRLYRVLQAS
jgi:transcription elongation GreA/GreB family factor